MNNELVGNSIRFVLLILFQVLVFNNMSLEILGHINPFPCVIFILLLPLQTNRMLVMTLSFAFGLFLDFFSNSGGANAAACLTLAYVRPLILVTSFGISYEHQNLKFNTLEFREMLIYVVFGCFIHHLVMFSLEVFDTKHFLYILKQTALSTVFTSICVLLFFGLIQKKKV